MSNMLMKNLAKISVSARTLQRMLNWYPPYLGAGIRMSSISPNFRHARMSMPLTFYNRNFVGTHFGGSLYSMVDPQYMLLLIQILGPEFIVWDKAATIEYVQPGTGTVTADFVIHDDLIQSLQALQPGEKKVFDLDVDVKDENGCVVAKFVKTEYVKRKDAKQSKA